MLCFRLFGFFVVKACEVSSSLEPCRCSQKSVWFLLVCPWWSLEISLLWKLFPLGFVHSFWCDQSSLRAWFAENSLGLWCDRTVRIPKTSTCTAFLFALTCNSPQTHPCSACFVWFGFPLWFYLFLTRIFLWTKFPRILFVLCLNYPISDKVKHLNSWYSSIVNWKQWMKY